MNTKVMIITLPRRILCQAKIGCRRTPIKSIQCPNHVLLMTILMTNMVREQHNTPKKPFTMRRTRISECEPFDLRTQALNILVIHIAYHQATHLCHCETIRSRVHLRTECKNHFIQTFEWNNHRHQRYRSDLMGAIWISRLQAEYIIFAMQKLHVPRNITTDLYHKLMIHNGRKIFNTP